MSCSDIHRWKIKATKADMKLYLCQRCGDQKLIQRREALTRFQIPAGEYEIGYAFFPHLLEDHQAWKRD